MAIAEAIISYNSRVFQSNFQDYSRLILLDLESGTRVFIAFPETRPDAWLTFTPGAITIFMTADQYEQVYHLLQTEKPVFSPPWTCSACRLVRSTPNSISASASQPERPTRTKAWSP